MIQYRASVQYKFEARRGCNVWHAITPANCTRVEAEQAIERTLANAEQHPAVYAAIHATRIQSRVVTPWDTIETEVTQ